MATPPDQATIDRWHRRIRAAGMRVTPQRDAVLVATHRLRHATPEGVWRAVRDSGSDVTLSTVYRALESLEDVGLIRHVHVDTGPPSYHVAEEYDHIHLSCTQCGAVASVPRAVASPFVTAIAQDTGFRADVAHASIYGLCRHCAGTEGVAHGDAGSGDANR